MSQDQKQYLGEYAVAASNLCGMLPAFSRVDAIQALRRCRSLILRGRFENGRFAPRWVAAAAPAVADALLDSLGV